MKAYILLQDGTVIKGKSNIYKEKQFGEIVFNTGMTGYQEIFTDPSYAGQIVVMSYPLIGNYGINSLDIESVGVKVNGFVVKEISDIDSNSYSETSISEYLEKNDIVCISEVDTRMIIKKIRDKGAMNCVITCDEIDDDIINELKDFSFDKGIVKTVSRSDVEHIEGSGVKLGILDFGIKTSIIEELKSMDCDLSIFPYDTDYKDILKYNLDALLLSNGPGDPKDVPVAIENTKNLLGNLPMFGICLGHQILALAMNADTYKLKFGHRGSNHPVIDVNTNRVYITSQNHGYAVSYDSIMDDIDITHKNVNDDTIEGFKSDKYNVYAVQFHPEAGPGPNDAKVIIETWINNIKRGDYNA